jgi:hypothetical protein
MCVPFPCIWRKIQGGKVKEFMTRTFTINGKLYQAREITFNTICELEDAGVSLTEIEQKPISTVRSYFAICLGGNKEYAGQEIEKHIINGGSLDEIMTAFREELADSDFFQALTKTANEEAAENQEAETAKRTRKK